MNILTTLNRYKSLGDYFAPDYKRDNEVLNDFKKSNPSLSMQQESQLVHILKNSGDSIDKYFVADLLYLYNEINQELLELLLQIAINHRDPSFNRIFLQPCIISFGVSNVADRLAGKFKKGEIDERIGISNLIYWLSLQGNGELENLHQVILEKAGTTKNLVELYHYKLFYSNRIDDSSTIPDNADGLLIAINGNAEYEDLLFNKLGWPKATTDYMSIGNRRA